MAEQKKQRLLLQLTETVHEGEESVNAKGCEVLEEMEEKAEGKKRV